MRRQFVLGIICLIITYISPLCNIEAAVADLYKVGINDIVDIRVIDHPELSIIATVTDDGTIMFPYIGTVRIEHLTLTEIEKLITEKLSAGFVKYPVVTVALIQSRSKKIYSFGAVIRQGEISYEENMTVIKAMSLIGGASQEGFFGKLIVRRKVGDSNKYKDLVEADLNNGFLHDRKAEDVPLEPDDILIVERNESILIQGEVSRRGRIVLEKGMTVLRVLLQAGGVTTDGLFGRIKLRRKQSEGSDKYIDVVEAHLNNGLIEDSVIEETLLEPDDILLVERNESILIQGEVSKRGRIVLEKGMTVLSALLQAGGVTTDGLYGRIKLRRKQAEGSDKYIDVVEAQLNDGFIEDSVIEETLLQPDDILHVERNKTFLIYGEVNKTGEFILKNRMTVFKAITIAGGFTKWGSESRVSVLRTDPLKEDFATIKVRLDDVIDGKAAADLYLQPGDIIIVSTGIL